jgi:nicotinamide-nucleotide amidase
MQVELINTGSELMLGRVLNTHQQWICRRVSDFGWTVERQVAVADTALPIKEAVRESLARAEVVITTGGLGPTSDDLTRDHIAELLNRKLVLDPQVLAHIESCFATRKRSMPGRTRVQALVPEGARVLPNRMGTAPGLAMEIRPNPFNPRVPRSWLVMLPGPPRELQPMFDEQVIPLLKDMFPGEALYCCRTLRTTGIGESVVEERIAPALSALVSKGLEIGYCARPGEVDVRFVCRGPHAESLVVEAEKITRERLAPQVYGVEDEELESLVVRALSSAGKTLALAESCTGGLIAHRLTNVPGASAALRGGVVVYHNDIKVALTRVQSETLARYGAVSEEVAREMAEGIRTRAGADYAIGVTGIAGPSGGSEAKPVGTVFIALASASKTTVVRQLNAWERQTFKQVTSQRALDMLRLRIVEDHGAPRINEPAEVQRARKQTKILPMRRCRRWLQPAAFFASLQRASSSGFSGCLETKEYPPSSLRLKFSGAVSRHRSQSMH